MWLLFVCFFYLTTITVLGFCLCFCFLLIYFYFYLPSVSLPGDDVLCWLLSCPFSSVCFLCSWFDLVWFRLSCDHGWIRSGSVNNVR